MNIMKELPPEYNNQSEKYIVEKKTLPEFVHLQENNVPHSSDQTHQAFPTMPDTISHLKLLNAFEVLKNHICHGLTEEKLIESAWKAFVTNSVRRFIIFISALRYSFPQIKPDKKDVDSLRSLCYSCDTSSRSNKLFTQLQSLDMDKDFKSTMNQLLPPLDILMVWHAFLLNPKSCYFNFARNGFLKFIFYPLPLISINEAISNEDFSYNPPQILIDNFNIIVKKYGNSMEYEFNEPFIPEKKKFPLKCPICQNEISQVIISDMSKNNGFADGKFKHKLENNCNCGF